MPRHSIFKILETMPSRAELDLLLQLGRLPLEEVTELSSFHFDSVDWEAFLTAAVHHGVLPLVSRNLQALGKRIPVPPPLREKLRALAQANAHRTLGMAAESIRLVRLLASAGIVAFLQKGPALSAWLYQGDPTMRQSCDLDLWVKKKDAVAADKMLQAAGFLCHTHFFPRKFSSLAVNYCALGYSPPNARGSLLELHWSLYPRGAPFSIDHNAVWSRLESFPLLQQPILQPAVEDTFLLLALHGCFHRFERLVWLSDLWALSRTRTVDWPVLQRRAERFRLQRPLAISCLLVERLFHLRWPIFQWASTDRLARELAGQMANSYFTSTADQAAPGDAQQEGWGKLGYIASLSRSQWDRAVYALSLWLVPNEKEWRIARLPPALDFLYVPLRPLRIIAEHGLRPLRPFFKR